MRNTKIVVSDQFEKSYHRIIEDLSPKQAIKLGRLIKNLLKMLTIFPESYPLLVTKKQCEIPFRKATLTKKFILVYLYRQEKVYLIDIFNSAQDWEKKLIPLYLYQVMEIIYR